jgi:hypothetical protein
VSDGKLNILIVTINTTGCPLSKNRIAEVDKRRR